MLQIRPFGQREKTGTGGFVDALSQQHFGIGLLLQVDSQRLAFQFQRGGNGIADMLGAKRNQRGFFARENLLKVERFDGIGCGQLGQVNFHAGRFQTGRLGRSGCLKVGF